MGFVLLFIDDDLACDPVRPDRAPDRARCLAVELDGGGDAGGGGVRDENVGCAPVQERDETD